MSAEVTPNQLAPNSVPSVSPSASMARLDDSQSLPPSSR